MRKTCLAKGFTLIEILVTVAIFAGIIGLYSATLSSTSLARESAHTDLALRIANQKLDDLRAAGYSSLPSSGSFTDPQLSNLPDASASTTVGTLNAGTKSVLVTVSWVENGKDKQSVSLETLMTSVGGL